MKTCSKCNIKKPLSDFYKHPNTKDGLDYSCKQCKLEYAKEYRNKLDKNEVSEYFNKYRKENKEQLKRSKAEYYQKNKEKISLYYKEYYKENKEKVIRRNKNWVNKNKKRVSLQQKVWREKNKDRVSISQKNWAKKNKKKTSRRAKERYRSDPRLRLINILSRRLKSLLKGHRSKHAEKIIGLSSEQLRKYLEDRFEEGMTWDNWGQHKLTNEEPMWNVDHIIPISFAETEEQIKILSDFSNLQPMWGEANIKKNNRMIINDELLTKEELINKYKTEEENLGKFFRRILQ